MNKKIIGMFITLVLCLNSVSVESYAKDNKAFQVYQEAIQTTTASGCWTEYLTITANMSISKENTKVKTKVIANSNMDVSNYFANDLSSLKITGSADISVMGQKYDWTMQYENGIAHYQYTEPNQTNADIETEPNCFDFDSVTEDMMEKAKVSGNKITFTIPGEKMEQAEIAAVNIMPGIDNLDYDDVDVEVAIDSETGAIEKMVMTFTASLTYQGYNAEVDYQIDYAFGFNDNNVVTESVEDEILETEIDDGIIIYSDYQNLSVRKDSTITLCAGIIVEGEKISDVSGITFWTEDSSILEIRDTGIKNNLRYVKFDGVDVGTTYVNFSDSNTGYNAKVLVTVYEDNYLSYTLNVNVNEYLSQVLVNF